MSHSAQFIFTWKLPSHHASKVKNFTTSSNNINAQRPLLVLDVDETLLHAADAPLERPADFRCGPYFVYRRPHVREFLLECSELCQLAVWSSSGADYLDLVLAETIPPEVPLTFVWSRSRCVQRYDAERLEPYFVKDLKKVKRLGFDLARILIVDDTPKKVERNYGNAIYVKPFVGDNSDGELLRLTSYLRSLAAVEDVRLVEKRGWQTSVVTGE